jgi:bifunctional UDP-N-acetylglucosamine pyrophosphorylase/glucosamine-1-phosphate N-acetyltransferase
METKSMKAVILAAGKGSRMQPLTQNRPKVMLPIANKPIIEHLISEVIAAGIDKFIFVVGYYGDQIKEYFSNGNNWNISIEYTTQHQQLGTADAIKAVKPLVKDAFLVINGDVIIGAKEIAKIINVADNSIGIKEVNDARGLGVVEISDSKIKRIYEKYENPPTKIANVGIYRFKENVFDILDNTPKTIRGEHEIPDTIQLMINQGKTINGCYINDWLECSYPWDLLAANKARMGDELKNEGRVENNVVIQGNVSIGAGTIIRSGSYIVGPVVIGTDCEIGPNCYIRPFSSIGNSCRIGAAVEVKDSIIMGNTKFPHHNYVGDSIIGEKCNFGSGTKIANLRLDGKNVIVSNVDTKRHKLGAIIGDGVISGINACINVGTVIGNNTVIGPGAIASGVIMPDSRVL